MPPMLKRGGPPPSAGKGAAGWARLGGRGAGGAALSCGYRRWPTSVISLGWGAGGVDALPTGDAVTLRKLRLLVLPLVGLLGLGASYALADSGHGRHFGRLANADRSCPRAHLVGTIAAPQTLTVTVAKSGGDGSFSAGDVVTVTLGSAGQT